MSQSLAARLRNIDARVNLEEVQHVWRKDDTFKIATDEKGKFNTYIPTPTGHRFHSDDSFMRLIMGPVGSGKSTACLFEIVKRACEMPPWLNGKRSSKWAIVRSTLGELEIATIQTWLRWFTGMGTTYLRKKPVRTLVHTFNDGKGIVELQILWIALDREADASKVKSLELTGAYINELSATPLSIFTVLQDRLRRYPGASICNELGIDRWSGMIADTNPPSTAHWIYDVFEVKSPRNHIMFKQPPGLLKVEGEYVANPDADNVQNLDDDYYTSMVESKPGEDHIKVYALGEYGSTAKGKLVYDNYNDDIHSAKEVEPIEGLPIHLGWDYGLTPGCVIAQLTPAGQFRLIEEIYSEHSSVREFVYEMVLPRLNADYKSFELGYSEGDPSGHARSQTDGNTCEDILRKAGLPTVSASTQNIPRRLDAVKFFLNRLVDKEPAFLLSRKKCPHLRTGFVAEYVWESVKTSQGLHYKDTPCKNSYSHLQDALQYICLRFIDGAGLRSNHSTKCDVDLLYAKSSQWRPTL